MKASTAVSGERIGTMLSLSFVSDRNGFQRLGDFIYFYFSTHVVAKRICSRNITPDVQGRWSCQHRLRQRKRKTLVNHLIQFDSSFRHEISHQSFSPLNEEIFIQ